MVDSVTTRCQRPVATQQAKIITLPPLCWQLLWGDFTDVLQLVSTKRNPEHLMSLLWSHVLWFCRDLTRLLVLFCFREKTLSPDSPCKQAILVQFFLTALSWTLTFYTLSGPCRVRDVALGLFAVSLSTAAFLSLAIIIQKSLISSHIIAGLSRFWRQLCSLSTFNTWKIQR